MNLTIYYSSSVKQLGSFGVTEEVSYGHIVVFHISHRHTNDLVGKWFQ
jgi:hypothetical protein